MRLILSVFLAIFIAGCLHEDYNHGSIKSDFYLFNIMNGFTISDDTIPFYCFKSKISRDSSFNPMICYHVEFYNDSLSTDLDVDLYDKHKFVHTICINDQHEVIEYYSGYHYNIVFDGNIKERRKMFEGLINQVIDNKKPCEVHVHAFN